MLMLKQIDSDFFVDSRDYTNFSHEICRPACWVEVQVSWRDFRESGWESGQAR